MAAAKDVGTEKQTPVSAGVTADSSSRDDNSSGTDVEAGSGGDGELKRGMNKFHLQFIAIGATFGTGLFIGSGQALAQSGPVSCLLAFILVGAILFSVMTSMGEMATFMPVAGSFTAYTSRFVDRSLGFSMGYIYWFSWAITFPLELLTSGLIIQYWAPNLNVGIVIAIFWVAMTAINYMPVKYFGEFEMWFCSIKVITVIGFIIFAICIDAGAGQHGYLGFDAWVNPGPFTEYVVPGGIGKFVGFWSVLVTAGFSYQGAELVGVGAGETENPSKSVPSAIRWTFWGVFSLFVGLIFFVGLIVPSDNKHLLSDASDASASPLVIAANLAGVPVLPHIINAVLLTAVLSAANSNLYSGSRILIALANEGNGPAFLARTNRLGTPYISVAITSAMGLLAFLNLSSSGALVFNWFLNITAIAGFICWCSISICHLRFMAVLKQRGINRFTELNYWAPFQPYLTWFGLLFCVLIILTNGFTVFIKWNTADFFAAYVSLILFVVLFVGHKIIMRTKPVKIEEVDIDTGRVKN